MKTVSNQSELRNLVCTILDSAEKTRKKLQNMSAEEFLFNGKFGSLGTKWDNPAQDDDLGEQIQQSMTMLMTCYAMDSIRFALDITKRDGTFTINDDDKNGVDLSFEWNSGHLFTLDDYFTDERKPNQRKYILAKKALCEIFTAKSPYNNNKIFHDLRVLSERNAEEDFCVRFIFFCSPEKLSDTRLKCKQENIEIIGIKSQQEETYGKHVYQKTKDGFKFVNGRFDLITAENYKIKYKIDDIQYRAFVTQITPESLLTWAKGVAADWK